jgi:DNA mismatch endonuclease (patch repair protein)
MADTLSPEARSRLMSRIRGKDTKPELAVRRILHSMGYRFRLHRRDLPGNPDIVLPRHGACIFVHGCFWHLHSNCKDARIPKTKRAWWRKKLEGNVARDKRHAAALRRLGWRVITVWECQTEQPQRLLKRLANLLPAPARKFCAG